MVPFIHVLETANDILRLQRWSQCLRVLAHPRCQFAAGECHAMTAAVLLAAVLKLKVQLLRVLLLMAEANCLIGYQLLTAPVFPSGASLPLAPRGNSSLLQAADAAAQECSRSAVVLAASELPALPVVCHQLLL